MNLKLVSHQRENETLLLLESSVNLNLLKNLKSMSERISKYQKLKSIIVFAVF